MATISIADNDARIQHSIGSGGNTANSTTYAIDFPFFALDDIDVTITTAVGVDTVLSRGSGAGTFAVSGTSVDDGFSGGSITLGSVYTSVTVTITRDIPIARTSDFATSGPFNISSLNTELDKVYAVIQQVETNNVRSLTMPDSDALSAITLPGQTARLGTVLGFNASTGQAEVGPTIANVNSLSAITANINTVGGISANVTTVAGISANVTTVAGISSNVSTVAGISANVTTVAGKASLISSAFASGMSLVTSDFVTDANALNTSAIIEDMGLLATSTVIEDMGLLATSANVTVMGVLGTSDNVTAMGKLGNDTTVADMAILATDAIVADMAILANSTIVDDLAILATSDIVVDMALLATSANVTAMGHLGTSGNVTAMGLLGTSAVVTDLGLLGTSAVVEDLSILATSANVTAMGLLGTSAVIEDMGLLGVAAVIEDMALLGVAGVIEDMGILGTSANVTAMSNVSGSIANVNTVATNIASVNNFGEVYRIASSAPSASLTAGDLYFNTSTNVLNVYGASGWQNAGSSVNGTSQRYHYDIGSAVTSVTGSDASSNTLAYDAGYVDVYVNGVRMSTADVTVTSGDTVTFASALASGDEVDIVAYGTFAVASLNADNLDSGTIPDARITGAYTGITNLTATGVGSFGSLDISGDIDVDGTTNLDVVDIDGAVNMATTALVTGVLTANGGAVFNEGGADVDFRIESDTITHALFVDGATGSVGIGTTAPILGAIHVLASGTSDASLEHVAHLGKNSTSRAGLQILANATQVDLGMQAQAGAGNLNLSFSSLAGGTNTERMRITSAGNVGIGTSSPSDILHIKDTASTNLLIDAPTDNASLTLQCGSSDAGAEGAFIQFIQNTTAKWQMGMNTDNTFRWYNYATSSEAMQIDSSGNLLVGTTNPVNGYGNNNAGVTISTTRAQVFSNSSGDYGLVLNKTSYQSGSTCYQINFRTLNQSVGGIFTNNSATIYSTSSDYRLKENVVTDWDATTRLKQLKPSRFNFIADADTTVDGFLAHEVQAIVPEAISGTKDAVDADGNAVMQGIDQSKLVPLLVKTIQELEARITAGGL